jgi:ABC-type Fe3+/spermidine/putrescine transport system ATPase subunit
MKHLELRSIRKSFGDFRAINDISLALEKGERLSLLGPSGCGKTTLLNVIAGFFQPESGQVVINGRDITNTEAYKRNIGVVFQSYALFPHLTVQENVYFGLRMRNISRADARLAISKAISLVRLHGLEERYPSQLSGGQQQRLAIARAIAIQPQILCLDEPLSNLDAKLRDEMRTDLLEILSNLSTTTIFVTHDQSEALSLSHRIAVLNRGRIEQIDTPTRIYEFPQTHFVANFLGESNRLSGALKGASDTNRLTIELDGGAIISGRGVGQGIQPLARSIAYVRADRISAGSEPLGADNTLIGTLKHAIYMGSSLRLIVDTAVQRVVVQTTQPQAVNRLVEGGPVHLGWSTQDTIIMAASTSRT